MQALLADAAFYWLLWLIFSLIGFLIGWALRGALREKGIVQSYERSEQERNSLAHLYSQVRTQHDQKSNEIKKMTNEVAQLRQMVATFDLEKTVYHNSLDAKNAHLAKAESSAAHFAEKIVFLEEQALQLRTRNTQLTAEFNHLQDELQGWKTLQRDFSILLRQVQTLEANGRQLEQARTELRRQLDAAQGENRRMRQQRDSNALELDDAEAAAAPDHHTPATAPARRYDHTADADDLKVINGITPQIEQELYSMGFFSLEQISNWDENILAVVAAHLRVPVAQLRQANWAGQARRLLGMAR